MATLAAAARTALLDALAGAAPAPGRRRYGPARGVGNGPPAVSRAVPVVASAYQRVIGGCHDAPPRPRRPPVLIIEGLAVDPAYQDAGVGTALFLLLLARFDTAAALRLRAVAPNESRAGRAFYARFDGARRRRRASRILPPPADDLWFEWLSVDGFHERLDAHFNRRLRVAGPFSSTGSREES